MIRRAFLSSMMLFIWSGLVLAAPIGYKNRIETRSEGLNPVFRHCSELPSANQIEACDDFMKRLNPEHPDLLSQLESLDYQRLRRVMNTTSNHQQFKRIQLVSVPETLSQLIQQADGETVFILDAQYGDYKLENTVVARTNFALVGAADEWNDIKPAIKLGPDFGDTLVEMFDLDMVYLFNTAIFSNLSFQPQYFFGESPSLEFIIQSPSPLDYLIIDRVDFLTEDMGDYPLKGLVALDDLRGVANIVGSSLDITNVKEYAIVINACSGALDANCSADVSFNQNTAKGPENSGLLQVENVNNVSAEKNQFKMHGKAGFKREDAPVAVFNLVYEFMDAEVSGFFNLNNIDGCTGRFPFASITSPNPSDGLKGEIVYNKNNYGSCGDYVTADNFPGIVQRRSLPLSSSAGEPELTSTLAREMLSVTPSNIGLMFSDSFTVSPSLSTMTLTPTLITSSNGYWSTSGKPYSSSHWSSPSTTSVSHMTRIAPIPTTTSMSSGTVMPSPTSKLSSTTSSSGISATFSPFPSVSPSLIPGSGDMPSPSPKPTVLPPKQKKLISREVGGVAAGVMGFMLVLGEAYMIRKCIKEHTSPEDISKAWNVFTLGMCYCKVKFNSRHDSSLVQLQSNIEDDNEPLINDNDSDEY